MTDKVPVALIGITAAALALALSEARLSHFSYKAVLAVVVVMAFSVIGGVAFYLGLSHARRRRDRRQEPPPSRSVR